MGMNPKLLPENIRKCMQKEDRIDVGILTDEEATRKRNDQLEKEVQEEIARLLQLRGIWFERKAMHKKSTGTVGCPDFLLAVHGNAVAIEVKVGSNNLSDDQIMCRKQMMENKWSYFVVRELSEAKAVLDWVDNWPEVRY